MDGAQRASEWEIEKEHLVVFGWRGTYSNEISLRSMLRSKCTRLFNSTVSSFLNEVNSLRCSLNMEHLILCILSLSLFFFLSLYHAFSHFFPALSIPNDEKVNLIKKFRFLNTSFHFRSFSQSFNVPKWHKNEVWLLRINPNMSFFPLSISLTHSPTHPVLSPLQWNIAFV